MEMCNNFEIFKVENRVLKTCKWSTGEITWQKPFEQ
jgi:hypothetical protein